MESICVLLIEDNPGDARLVQEILKDVSDVEVSVEWVNELNKGIDLSIAQAFDVLLLDLNLPHSKGLETFMKAKAALPSTPILLTTGLDDEKLAVRASPDRRVISPPWMKLSKIFACCSATTPMDRARSFHLQPPGSADGWKNLARYSRGVGPKEFSSFAQLPYQRHPGIQALEWIPRVPNSRRVEFEDTAQRNGYEAFEFTEREQQGQMVRAGNRDEYFPVYYVEPFEGNEVVVNQLNGAYKHRALLPSSSRT